MTSRPIRSRALGTLSLAAALAAAAPLPAAAQPPPEKGVLGVGLIVGEPTGVSGKYYLADDTAVDLAIGGAIVGRGIQIHGDYLWHPLILEQKESFALPVYVGVGGRLLNHDAGGGEEDHLRLGVRGPVGVLFDFTRVPLDVFGEVAGIVDYRTKGDHFGLAINAGIGARYYF